MVSSSVGRVLAPDEVDVTVDEINESGLKIVFTNGVFDLIHPGHLATLRFAKSKGDILIVGLNSDGSVMRLKGPLRPIMGYGERAKILAGLDMVDFVVSFEEDTPARIIDQIRPHVLVKGGDYGLDDIVGRSEVESWGGVVFTVPLVQNSSTTNLVERILEKSAPRLDN